MMKTKRKTKVKVKIWECQNCGEKSFGEKKPTSCDGSGNALGCDGGYWKEMK